MRAAKNKDFTAVEIGKSKSRATILSAPFFLQTLFLDQGTGMGGAKGEPSISGECQGLGDRG
jgi:hypothetical protein